MTTIATGQIWVSKSGRRIKIGNSIDDQESLWAYRTVPGEGQRGTGGILTYTSIHRAYTLEES